MKSIFSKSTSIALVAVFVFMPVITSAQTSGSWYREGSNESRSERRARIEEYRRQSRERNEKIEALGDSIVERVSIPILFGVALNNISPNFGDPRSGGRTHEGEDILAPKGTPIVTPTKAVVLRVRTGDTEGNTIYTANPGGETFVYMHLDRFGEGVDEGDTLEAGELLGYVGDTGNAAGGPAHLHFEIHNDSGDPIDPFPRIKEEISLDLKMNYLSKILTQNNNQIELAAFLVRNFRATFTTAASQNISLPQVIIDAMVANPGSIPTTSPSLPVGDLTIGSSGNLVVELQKYLIGSASGPNATKLASAGATGYFGAITQSALLEFQVAHQITPSNGYYGVATRTYISGHPLSGAPIPTPPQTPSSATFTRNLTLGSSGSDVLLLQQTLNRLGFTVSTSGAGSVENETIYFGSATQKALAKFQAAKGITPAAGYLGPITRTVISGL